MIGLIGIITAYEHGCRNTYEMADYFNVTEEFLTDALDAPKAQVPLTEAAGQTACACINLYPPGIPIVAPGEQITQEAVDVITRYRQMNLPVQGVDHDAITILKLC